MNFLADKHIRTYSIVWDNVGKTVRPAHQIDSKTGARQYKSWANAIAVFNRVPPPTFISDDWEEGISAQKIPVKCLLPSFREWAQLQKRMVILISRTLVANIPYLNHLSDKYVEHHVEHEFSEESKQKSEIVSKNL